MVTDEATRRIVGQLVRRASRRSRRLRRGRVDRRHRPPRSLLVRRRGPRPRAARRHRSRRHRRRDDRVGAAVGLLSRRRTCGPGRWSTTVVVDRLTPRTRRRQGGVRSLEAGGAGVSLPCLALAPLRTGREPSRIGNWARKRRRTATIHARSANETNRAQIVPARRPYPSRDGHHLLPEVFQTSRQPRQRAASADADGHRGPERPGRRSQRAYGADISASAKTVRQLRLVARPSSFVTFASAASRGERAWPCGRSR